MAPFRPLSRFYGGGGYAPPPLPPLFLHPWKWPKISKNGPKRPNNQHRRIELKLLGNVVLILTDSLLNQRVCRAKMHCTAGLRCTALQDGDTLHCRVEMYYTAGWRCTPLQGGDALHCRVETGEVLEINCCGYGLQIRRK